MDIETPKSSAQYKPNDVDTLAKVVSERTNLSEHVCRELLLNGWTFTISLDKPDRWERIF